jgi:hypothetical protein
VHDHKHDFSQRTNPISGAKFQIWDCANCGTSVTPDELRPVFATAGLVPAASVMAGSGALARFIGQMVGYYNSREQEFDNSRLLAVDATGIVLESKPKSEVLHHYHPWHTVALLRLQVKKAEA